MSQNYEGVHPQHIAIIMDGNGRWAQERGMKRTAGHEQGMMAVKTVCREILKYEGVKVVTFYTFSTENWKRPLSEIKYLMDAPGRLFDDFMPELIENNFVVKLTGFPNDIPDATRKVIEKAANDTKTNDGIILNFAFNYGGQQEIVDASKKIAQDVLDGKLNVNQIDRERFDSYLLNTQSTSPYQNIDLMIRTSGEERLSNFLLWHNAYSEFYFTDTYWPDFSGEELDRAIHAYQERKRRYGGV